MRKSIRPLIAMTAALALTVTAGMSALAQADNTDKHFSVIEAASNEDSLTIPEIAKKCGTSVVAIETETKVVYNTYDNNYYNPFGGMFGYGYGYGYGNRGGRGGTQEYTQTAAGSGIIISEDGYVLTNNHVISGADKITVYVNSGDGSEEQSYEATLVGSSESNDIAVLKIDATGLNAAAFGDSDQIEVGELAVAIGNPMGQVHGSVTAGIISAVEQELTIDDVTINAIQTDAAINPGNSGGPTFNAAGQVIGINSSIASTATSSDSAGSIGIGFAIPSNLVKRVADEIIKDGKVKHVALGVVIKSDTVEADGVTRGGATITKSSATGSAVVSGGPADKAGLKEGDTIVAFNGNAVNNNYSLLGYVRAAALGDKVTLTIVRDGKTMDVDVTLDQEESSVNGSSGSDSNGNSQNKQNNQNGNGQNGYGNGNGNSDGGTGDGGGFSDPFGLW